MKKLMASSSNGETPPTPTASKLPMLYDKAKESVDKAKDKAKESVDKAKESVQKVWQSLIDSGKEEEPVPPDDNFFQLINYRPWDPEERQKFDERVVDDYISRQNPHCVKAEYEFKQPNRGSTRTYPLARLVALGASLKLVQKVHKLYPPAMMAITDFRSTTLHAACSFNAPLDVLKYILQQYPDAIRQPTKGIFLPLHNACQADIPSPLPLPNIKLLVEAYPEALLQANKLAETPLKTAQRNPQILPDVLEFLTHETNDRVAAAVKKDPQHQSSSNSSGHLSHTDKTSGSSSEFFLS